jgi:hypothetical protein
MRKKIAVGAGLVAVVLAVVVLVCDRMGPAEPPLRVGMNKEEVEAVLGQPVYAGEYHVFWNGKGEAANVDRGDGYESSPDLFGNHSRCMVHYNNNSAVRWEIEPLPRTRPPWLNRVLKAVGW